MRPSKTAHRAPNSVAFVERFIQTSQQEVLAVCSVVSLLAHLHWAAIIAATSGPPPAMIPPRVLEASSVERKPFPRRVGRRLSYCLIGGHQRMSDYRTGKRLDFWLFRWSDGQVDCLKLAGPKG